MSDFRLPKFILSRDGKSRGLVTGSTHRCRLAGCTGLRVTVRWPDGKITHPCSKGLQDVTDKHWRIL